MRIKYLALVLLTGFASVEATAQSAPPRMDIPTIAKAANGAIVSIVMSDKDGHALAQGSGFLVSKDGLVVTNYHVIAEGNSAVVKLPEGAFFVVDGVLAFDKARDVAVIKAHGENFRTLTLGNSDRLQVGEEVVAIGNPLSLESTVSNGIVSGIRTVEEAGGKFLQVTTPISPGSSGGPLFNMAGEVVGITTLYLKGGENLNFAIPINDAKRLLLAKTSKIQDLPNETEPVKAQTTDREPRSPVSNARLSETLQWLSGASKEESGDGNTQITFESKSRDNCAVTITETRVKAGPDFFLGDSFSLVDIDPADIQVGEPRENPNGEAFGRRSSVGFHTTNYSAKIIHTSYINSSEHRIASYFFFTNDSFAPRFAKALKTAVELCGGKPSVF